MRPSTTLRSTTVMAVAALAATSMLTACGSSTSTSADTSAPLHSLLPKDLQGKGSITIASNVEYPPFEFYDTDNKTVLGIDRAIADGLEKQLGIKIVFQNISFDAIIPGLASKRYAMAMSAMTDNTTRQKQVSFVDYFAAGAGVMVKDADKGTVKTLADLCGRKVGIVKGTTEVPQAAAASKTCESAGNKPIESIVYPGQNQMILALQNNRVSALAMDSAPGAYAASKTTGLYMNPPYESQPFGIVFGKGNGQLQKAVQKALGALKKSGAYDAALKKYGLESGSVDTFPIDGGVHE